MSDSDDQPDVTFHKLEVALLVQCVGHLQHDFDSNVARPILDRIHLRPTPVIVFQERLTDLRNILRTISPGGGAVPREELTIVKRALMQKLRDMSKTREERSRLTPDIDTKRELDEVMRPFEQLAEGQWFSETRAAMLPLISDYLVVSQIGAGRYDLSERQFDEKFGILTAPVLFLSDLAYYRYHCCELRGRPVTVGFLDIDDFKSFNTELTETQVDRVVLPRFMRTVEARVFGHGHAYRVGGDEYLVLLPNRGRDEAVQFFAGLQGALKEAKYDEVVQRQPTVSVGVCEITAESILTDRQVEGRAVLAKNHAKCSGKNRIAGFSDSLSTEAGLCALPLTDPG